MIVYHAPAANTDGDSLVFFRRSEVIAAGNLFSTVSYPVIDVEKGGTIQGVIDGLNQIIDLAVAEYRAQGGTWIIPGRGRLSDTADVASYRNMVTMIRDRMQDLKGKGMTLAAGEGRAADAGLRRPLRLDHRCLDDGHVRRGGLPDSPGEEVMRRVVYLVDRRSATGRHGRLRAPFVRGDVRRRRTKSSSKASWCSSSTAIRTRSCTSRRRTRRARSSGGRSSGPAPASWPRQASSATRSRSATGRHRRPSVARARRVPRADGEADATGDGFTWGGRAGQVVD